MLEATRVESILSFVSGDYKAEMKEINDTRKRLPNAVINPVLEVVRYKTEKGNEKIKLVGSDDRYPITLNEDVMTLLSHPKVAAFISESLKNLA